MGRLAWHWLLALLVLSLYGLHGIQAQDSGGGSPSPGPEPAPEPKPSETPYNVHIKPGENPAECNEERCK